MRINVPAKPMNFSHSLATLTNCQARLEDTDRAKGRPMALSQHAYDRIAKRVRVPVPAPLAPWSPPSMSDLVARIDAALGARRAS